MPEQRSSSTYAPAPAPKLTPASPPAQFTQVCTSVILEDPYRTLGVSSTADEKEIKAAYRRLALK